MTDQAIPDVTDEERMLAREWAESVESNTDFWTERICTAARVILHAVPAPTLPTLADMTEEEHFNAVGMWADVDGFHPYRAVIGDTPAPKVPVFRPTAGSLDWAHPEDVTPLPELGRAWSPGGSPTGTPAPAPALPDGWRLADHQRHGRVIVTNPTPDRDGRVYYVLPAADPRGYDWLWCGHSELTYIDQEDDTSATEGADTPTGPDHPAVGTVIESADDPRLSALPVGSVLRDCDGETVAKRHGEWRGIGYIPIPSEGAEFGPWKVMRIGWEADQ